MSEGEIGLLCPFNDEGYTGPEPNWDDDTVPCPVCGSTVAFEHPDSPCVAKSASEASRLNKTITSLTTQLEAERERATKAEAALREKAMEYLALDQQATEALERAVKAEGEADNLRRLLSRYRDETPLGHQPHMIAAEVDAALKTGEPSHD